MEERKQGFFQHPVVQGLLGALAVGANPAVGLLGGSILKGNRERNELKNEEARLRLSGLQRSDKAQQELAGLFNQKSMVRDQNADFALEGIGDAPDTPVFNLDTQVPTIQTPEGQNRALGLLMQASPQHGAQGLLNQMPQPQRSNTTQQKIGALQAEAARRGLGPEETNAFIDQNMGGGGNPIEMALAQLLADQRRQDIDLKTETADVEREERDRARIENQDSLRTTAVNLLEASKLNDQISASGFLNKPGLPFADARRTAAVVGGEVAGAFDNPELQERLQSGAAAVDNFSSLIPQIAIDRIATEGFDGRTNAKFNAFMQTKPSLEKLGPANSNTILRNLKGLLLADDRDAALQPAERKAVEDEIARLESMGITEDVPAEEMDDDAIKKALGL